jgi:hypothetical protein
MTESKIDPSWVAEAIRYGQDAGSGAEIEQLTSEPVTSTNIYCEQRYATADGSRIALWRRPFGRPRELWVCDLRSLRLCRVGEAAVMGANPNLNAIYYRPTGESDARLLRLNLATFDISELFRFGGPAPGSGAVSPDERWLVCGPLPVSENVFSLRRISLADGRTDTLCEIEDMFNPHLQFEPAAGRWVNVQINRGGRRDKATGGMRLTGDLGATLAAVDVETGEVVPLPAGRPHTPPISGHECWVGRSGRLLFTAGQYRVTASAFVTLGDPPESERAMPPAAIFSVAPRETAARIVAQDRLYNHLAASDDGHFFIADDHATGVIYIGSIATGRSLPLCDSHTRQGTCQYSHAHAYMTPDNRHVIFNSIVTGVAQVYAARVPEGFLEKLLLLR